MKNPIAATTDAMTMPVTSAAAVVAAIVDDRAEPDGAGATAAAAATALRAPSASWLGFLAAVVRVDDALRFAADRVDEARAIVVEAAGVLVADDPILVLPAALARGAW